MCMNYEQEIGLILSVLNSSPERRMTEYRLIKEAIDKAKEGFSRSGKDFVVEKPFTEVISDLIDYGVLYFDETKAIRARG